jgi:preprotein translocase subunit SecE
VNRQTKRLLQRQGQLGPDGTPTVHRPAAPPTRRAPEAAGEREPFGARVRDYLREVRNELVKVAWPDREEVVNYSVVVFVTLVLVTAFVFGLDYGFAKGVLVLFGR